MEVIRSHRRFMAQPALRKLDQPSLGSGIKDRVWARRMRGFGPVGILAILVILVGSILPIVPGLRGCLVILWAWLSRTPWGRNRLRQTEELGSDNFGWPCSGCGVQTRDEVYRNALARRSANKFCLSLPRCEPCGASWNRVHHDCWRRLGRGNVLPRLCF